MNDIKNPKPSWNDLTDKPTVDTVLSTSSTNAVANKPVTDALNARPTSVPSSIGIKIENIYYEYSSTDGALLKVTTSAGYTYEVKLTYKA